MIALTVRPRTTVVESWSAGNEQLPQNINHTFNLEAKKIAMKLSFTLVFVDEGYLETGTCVKMTITFSILFCLAS